MSALSVVYVTWLDSEGVNEWTPVGDITDELEETHSVGLLIRETETFLLLALSFDPATDSVHNFKKIPISAVVKVRKLCRLNLKT
jgi:hypothetical protein